MIIYGDRASVVLLAFLKKKVSDIKGKKFLIPVNICPIVPLIFLEADVAFEFVDINPKTLCISEEEVIQRIQKEVGCYGGILFNHTYGTKYFPSEFFKLLKIVDPYFIIVDDKCLCEPDFGFESMHVPDLTLFSTGYSKIVDLGYGGYGYCPDGSQEKIRLTYSIDSSFLNNECDRFTDTCLFETDYLFRNLKLDDPNGLDISWEEYVERIEEFKSSSMQERHELIKFYKDNISPAWCLEDNFQNWRFNILLQNKESFIDQVFQTGLFVSNHYRPLVKNSKLENYKTAFKLHEKVVNLFIDKYFSIEKAKRLVKILQQYDSI